MIRSPTGRDKVLRGVMSRIAVEPRRLRLARWLRERAGSCCDLGRRVRWLHWRFRLLAFDGSAATATTSRAFANRRRLRAVGLSPRRHRIAFSSRALQRARILVTPAGNGSRDRTAEIWDGPAAPEDQPRRKDYDDCLGCTIVRWMTVDRFSETCPWSGGRPARNGTRRRSRRGRRWASASRRCMREDSSRSPPGLW